MHLLPSNLVSVLSPRLPDPSETPEGGGGVNSVRHLLLFEDPTVHGRRILVKPLGSLTSSVSSRGTHSVGVNSSEGWGWTLCSGVNRSSLWFTTWVEVRSETMSLLSFPSTTVSLVVTDVERDDAQRGSLRGTLVPRTHAENPDILF